MKERFIRILSPITAAVVILLDAAVLGYGIFAIKKLMIERTTAVIFFCAIEIFALIVAALVTKEVFSNGVKFSDDEVEFLGLDDNNIFDYQNITNIKSEKDEKPSFTKNFVDRHAKLIITQKDESVTTIDIGLCTRYTLDLIHKEMAERSGLAYTPPKEIKAEKKKKEKSQITDDSAEDNSAQDKTIEPPKRN